MTHVSVVVRVRDEASCLTDLFDSLNAQVGVDEIDVVVVDNQSTDESAEIARNQGAKVVAIDKFTYGRALNLGLDQAQSECCVVLSAHSLPQHPDFLRVCVAALDNEQVGAARCMLAGKGADIRRWYAPELLGPSDDLLSKGPLASGCVIRRKTWANVPFDETLPAGEDKAWAYEIARLGWLILSPIPAIYAHSADRDAVERVRRNLIERRAAGRSPDRSAVLRRAPRKIAAATWEAIRVEALRLRG